MKRHQCDDQMLSGKREALSLEESQLKAPLQNFAEQSMSHPNRCLCVSIKASLYQFFTVNHSLFHAVTP